MDRRSLLVTLGASISTGGCQTITQRGFSSERSPSPSPSPTKFATVTDVEGPEPSNWYKGHISVNQNEIDEDKTARITISLTNISDRELNIKSSNLGYTLGLRKSDTTEQPVVILRNGKAVPDTVTEGCWQLIESAPPDAKGLTEIESGETLESVRYLYSPPSSERECLKPGEYHFRRVMPEWSFTLSISE